MGFLLLLKICGPAELPVPGLGFVWGLANQLRVGLHQAKSHRGVRPAVRKANLGEKSRDVQRSPPPFNPNEKRRTALLPLDVFLS